MKFSKDIATKYSKGRLIDKVCAVDRNIRFETIDVCAVARINNKVLVTVRQNNRTYSEGLYIAETLYTL